MSGSTDTNRIGTPWHGVTGRSKHTFAITQKEAEHAGRRRPLLGFPADPLTTTKAVQEYYSFPKIQCLLCGRWFGTLVTHLLRIHDISVTAYQDRFFLPRSRGLAGADASNKSAAAATRRMADTTVNWRQRRRPSAPALGMTPGTYMRAAQSERAKRLGSGGLMGQQPSAKPKRPCPQCGVTVTRSPRCWSCRYPADRVPTKRLSGWERARRSKRAEQTP